MLRDLFDKCREFAETSTARMAEEGGFYPYFIPISSQAGPEVTIGGRNVIMLGSNNYLGLTQHPHVIERAIEAIRTYGSACTGSRALNGTSDLHLELESRLARWTGREAALCFTTGYQTNLGIISALVGRHDYVVLDRSNHASIVDGARLSFGRVVRYRHNDMEDLERVLASLKGPGGALIVVDGVFSMEGDLANLREIVRLKKKYNARLLVDEAHSVGVFGENGRGVAEHFGVEEDVDLIMGTFSKSFASIGGFVAGPADAVYHIKHHARSFVFSASMPPAQVGAALGALDIIEREPERRNTLWRHAIRMKRELSRLGFDTGCTQSPIVPIIVGEEIRLAHFWKAMFDRGVFTNAAVPPSVEPGRALIRTSYMATHTDEHLDRALEIIEDAGRSVGLI